MPVVAGAELRGLLACLPHAPAEHAADLRQGLRPAPDHHDDQHDDQDDEEVAHVVDGTPWGSGRIATGRGAGRLSCPLADPGPLLVYGPRSTTYDFGPEHPLTPRRFGPGI